MPYFQKDDYPELPEDTPLLCEITEVEMTRSRAFGSDEMRDQVAFLFEVVEGEFAGPRSRVGRTRSSAPARRWPRSPPRHSPTSDLREWTPTI